MLPERLDSNGRLYKTNHINNIKNEREKEHIENWGPEEINK